MEYNQTKNSFRLHGVTHPCLVQVTGTVYLWTCMEMHALRLHSNIVFILSKMVFFSFQIKNRIVFQKAALLWHVDSDYN